MALQVDLLQESFQAIAPQGNDFIASFYDRLFTNYPETRTLFTNTDMQAQHHKLLMNLILVIENLTQPEILTDALSKLGSTHHNVAVTARHYPMVGAALLATFAEFLGDQWTPKLEAAWNEAYNTVAAIMLNAYPATAEA